MNPSGTGTSGPVKAEPDGPPRWPPLQFEQLPGVGTLEVVKDTRQGIALRKAEESWQRTLRRDRTSLAWQIWHRFGLAFWGLIFILNAVRTVLHIMPSFFVFAWNLLMTVGLLGLVRRIVAIIRREPHPPGMRLALKAAGPQLRGVTRNGHDVQLTTGSGDNAEPSGEA
jgi:hypothetical protein